MILKRFTLGILFVLFLNYSTQTTAKALGLFNALDFGLPNVIAGHPVLAVKTSDNTACMRPNTKQILLQSASSLENFLTDNNDDWNAINKALDELRKTDTSKLEVSIIGDGVSYEEIATSLQNFNPKRVGANDCMKYLPQASPAQNGSSIARGKAIIRDTDANSFWNDNAQSVWLRAPHETANMPNNDGVAFLNNVTTNFSYALQAGLGMGTLPSGNVLNAGVYQTWDQTPQVVMQGNFTLLIAAGRDYYFTISYTNGYWWECMKDTTYPNQQAYQCVSDYATNIGDNLGNSSDTSVWVETITTNPLWYNAFSDTYWTASHALIYRNGIGQNWSSTLFTKGATSCNNPLGPTNPNPFGGDLANGGTATFKLTDLYIQCF